MAGLEEQWLQRNVPGRFSSWQGEEDQESERQGDCCSGGSEEDDDEEEEADTKGQPGLDDNDDDQEWLQYREEGGHQTGPKGVLADHRAQQRAAYEQAARARAHRQAVLHRIARGAQAEPSEAHEAEDEDEDEDGFLQRYREQRLQQLRRRPQATPATTPNATAAAFGTLERAAGGPDLLRLLNEAQAAGAPAVVHAGSPHVAACRRLDAHLAALAARHPRTRFLAIAGPALGFDPSTLPVLIAYGRHGEVADSLPCADEALGLDDVAWWLEGAGVLRR